MSVALTVIFPVVAQAGANPAIQTTNDYVFGWNQIAGNSSAGGTIGWQFTVASGVNLTVDELGFYDNGHVALDSAHPVGLWDANSNLLGEVTIPAGVSTNYLSGYTYEPLPDSVTLNAGDTYYIGAYYAPGSHDKLIVQYINPIGQDFDSNITWDTAIQTRFNEFQTGLDLPDNHLAPQGTYKEAFFGPTFSFTPEAAPEPATYALFGLCALALFVKRSVNSKAVSQ